MAVLGQMATGITHELTQPLGAIRTLSGNAQQFLARGDLETLSGNLGLIARLTDQMGAIIQPLKSFARKSKPQPAATDVHQALHGALFLFEQRLRRERVRVIDHSQAGQCSVWCEPNRLQQVLINLIGNALDAMAANPESRPRLLSIDVRAAAATADGKPGWAIDVADSGPGLGALDAAQLFEPFFTTKAQGAGLGLGLTISRDIAREQGGDLRAAAAPDGGALFTLLLPAPPAAENAGDD